MSLASQPGKPPLPSPPAASSVWRSWGPLLLILVPLAVVDVSVAPLMRAIRSNETAALFVYSCFGLILSQGGILTCVLVCGNGPFWKRLLLHWFFAMALTGAWALGLWLSLDADWNRLSYAWDREAGAAVCSFPAASLALQLPLWLARYFFQWRLEPRSQSPIASPFATAGQHFSIYDLMLATAIVAASLALFRIAPMPSHLRQDPLEAWGFLGLFAGICLGLSLVAVVPLVWFFTLPAHLLLRWLIAVGYALVIGASTLIVPASGLLGRGFEPFLVLAFFVVMLSYGLAMCVALSLLQSAGLEWKKGNAD